MLDPSLLFLADCMSAEGGGGCWRDCNTKPSREPGGVRPVHVVQVVDISWIWRWVRELLHAWPPLANSTQLLSSFLASCQQTQSYPKGHKTPQNTFPVQTLSSKVQPLSFLWWHITCTSQWILETYVLQTSWIRTLTATGLGFREGRIRHTPLS